MTCNINIFNKSCAIIMSMWINYINIFKNNSKNIYYMKIITGSIILMMLNIFNYVLAIYV